MYRCVFGLLVVAALCGTAAEAQTITGRIEPVWDEEREQYTYAFEDRLWWRLQVAPSSARSDELSVYLYYNKRAAWMTVAVLCRDVGREDDYQPHARSTSLEHFVSLTTGLITGDVCFLTIYGGSSRDEVLSYRMAVSERAARTAVLLE